MKITRGQLTFELNEDCFTAKILPTLRATGDIIIPSSITHRNHEYFVTVLSENFITHCFDIGSIYFEPNCLLRIIGKASLSNSNLNITNITIPSSVTEICDKAFECCTKLEKINFLDDSQLILIGSQSFRKSSLKSFKLPKTVTEIGDGAFSSCEKLTEFSFNDNLNLKIISSQLFYESSVVKIHLPKNIVEIKNGAFSFCKNLKTVIFSKSNNVKIIGDDAFNKSGIEFISIPSNVFSIGKKCFCECEQLKKVEFSENSDLCSFSEELFFCSGIESIFIPPKCESLEFAWCSRTNNVKSVSVSPLNHHFKCIDNKFIIGKSNQASKKFDTLVFVCRNVKEFILPSYIKKIEQFAFSNCSELNEFVCSKFSKLSSIGKYAFSHSSVSKIQIPKNVKNIEEGWFSNTNNLIKIDVSPRNNCFCYYNNQFLLFKSNPKFDFYDILCFARRDIKHVIIPSKIRKISSHAFNQCKEIESIKFEKNSELAEFDLYSLSASSIKNISIPSNIKIIKNYAFYGCFNLESFIIQSDSKLSVIDDYSFFHSNINEINFPSSLIKIEKCAFYECSNLKSVTFSKNSQIEIIPQYCFYKTGIEKILIPSSVIKIEESAFEECNLLNSIEFEENSKLSEICKSAFAYNNNVESLNLPSNLINIGRFGFFHLNKLRSLNFSPDCKIDTINMCTFSNIMIENLVVPPSIKLIKESGFGGIIELKSVEFLGEEITILSFCFEPPNKLFLVSFPNAKVIKLAEKSIYDQFIPDNFVIFVKPGVEIQKHNYVYNIDN